MINLVVLGSVVVCTFIAILVYYSSVKNVFKLVCLPLIFAFFVYTIYALYDIMGAPVESFPPPEFEYIHHESTNRGEEIIVWVKVDDRHRLYIFDYTRENMKELEEAKAKKEGGEQDVPMQTTQGGRLISSEHDAERDIIGSDESIKAAARAAQNGN